MPDLSLHDLTNHLPDPGAAIAAAIGFIAAFSRSLSTRVMALLQRFGAPFSGLWLRLRIIASSKRVYDALYALAAADSTTGSATKPLRDALAVLERLGGAPEAPKPKPRKKRQTRATTPAEGGPVQASKPPARIVTPAEGETVPATA